MQSCAWAAACVEGLAKGENREGELLHVETLEQAELDIWHCIYRCQPLLKDQ